MAFTRSGVRSPSPPLQGWATGIRVRKQTHRGQPYTGDRLKVRFWRQRGNSSVGRAQPCQGWGRGFESRFPLWEVGTLKVGRLDGNTFHIPTVQHSNGFSSDAGWSSLVARRAHNPEVVGSNPTPATSIMRNAKFEMRNVHFAFRIPHSAFQSGRLAQYRCASDDGNPNAVDQI